MNYPRQNIKVILNPGSPEMEYFKRLCNLEDADEASAIESRRRHTALEYGVRVGGNTEQALQAAQKFLEFLRAESVSNT